MYDLCECGDSTFPGSNCPHAKVTLSEAFGHVQDVDVIMPTSFELEDLDLVKVVFKDAKCHRWVQDGFGPVIHMDAKDILAVKQRQGLASDLTVGPKQCRLLVQTGEMRGIDLAVRVDDQNKFIDEIAKLGGQEQKAALFVMCRSLRCDSRRGVC